MCKEDWFKSWFDTPYYHQLYKHRDYRDAQLFLDALLGFLSPQKGAKILDLACGRGRHTDYLRKQGYEVTGLDLSEKNISYAKLNHPGISFKRQDMREPFGKEKFNFVVNLFTSFGYFGNEENQLAINNMAESLMSEGILILDFLNAYKVSKGLVADDVIEAEGIEFKIKRRVKEDKIVKQISFSDNGKDYNFSEEVALLDLSDFESFCDNAGLNIFATFGDFTLSPFSAEQSDRLILMAKKK